MAEINIKDEIERINAALQKTNSPYLKRDYQKYLQKLKRKQRMMRSGK
jgi:hypothetical protein